jgi:hypothetical protein
MPFSRKDLNMLHTLEIASEPVHQHNKKKLLSFNYLFIVYLTRPIIRARNEVLALRLHTVIKEKSLHMTGTLQIFQN